MMPDPKNGETLVGGHFYPKLTTLFHDHILKTEGVTLGEWDLVTDGRSLASAIDKELDLARLKGIAQLRNSLLVVRSIHAAHGREDAANALLGAVGIANAMLGKSVSDYQIDDVPSSVATQAAADVAEAQSNPFTVRPPV